VCGTPLGKPYLDLGMQPLANALRTPGDTSEEFKAPLSVALCENCGLSQLTVVVDPEVLYKGYRFRSGTSEAWRKHCADLAEQCGEPGRMLDIAANDGTCMDAFKAGGWSVTGVDTAPARSDIMKRSWDSYAGHNIFRGCEKDLIIAQNVLGHVDDPIDFLKGIKAVLAEDGQAVIEVPNVGTLIDDCAFDTIYHEHLSYWSSIAIDSAVYYAELCVERVEGLPHIHGGSARLWLRHNTDEYAVPMWTYRDVQPRPYAEFAQRVSQQINKTAHLVDKASRKNFIAWGASAKGAVYLNALHNKWPAIGLPQYVIDETPEKVGLLMPGVPLVPIVAPPYDLSGVDVIWVLSWNWFEEIKRKAESRGFKGQYLVTSPKPELK
jgi:SAM-dependent methyltransferase